MTMGRTVVSEATIIVATRKSRTIGVGNAVALGTVNVRRDGGAVQLRMQIVNDASLEIATAEGKLYREQAQTLRDELNRLLAEGISND